MYKLTDIKDIHLEITCKCNARCPMCSRTKLLNEGKEHLLKDEITLDLFKSWFPNDFIKQLVSLRICGSYGDPIMAKDTLEILQYLRDNNNDLKLKIFTNGGARDDAFWKKLAELKVKINFDVDGLADTNKLYRVNTVWEKIMHNAKTFIDAGGVASWHMLVFEHNQHQVEECRALAKSTGFVEFEEKHTTRFNAYQAEFPVYNENKQYTHSLKPTEISKKLNEKKKLTTLKDTIECKALKGNSLYISAAGNVTPCSLTETSKRKQGKEYLDRIGKFYSLYDYTLKEIFETGTFDKIKEAWNNIPLEVCSRYCGSFKKCDAQLIGIHNSLEKYQITT